MPLPDLYPLDGFQYEEDHAYTQLANWLIPDRVMVGRYPSREVGEEQVGQLLRLGITTFVCLQAELPPQQRMPIGGQGSGFLPYMPVATMLASSMTAAPDVGVMGRTQGRERVMHTDGDVWSSAQMNSSIRNGHLDQFLPGRRGASDAGGQPMAGAEEASRAGCSLDFVHCPIADLGVPTFEQVQTLLSDLTARLQRGEILYIHCWGGRGRAGTVGACLLATLYGIHGDEALRRVQKAFNTRGDDVGRWSPETVEQREFVRSYVARIRQAG